MKRKRTPPDVVKDALRAEGLRMTRQRSAIVEVLDTAEDHPDAVEIHERAKAIEPTTSLATVYRTLAVLADKGVVTRLLFDGAPSRFESAGVPHHDHIIDLDTGGVIEFVSPEIERLQREVAKANGYEVVWHRLELYCRKVRN
jgi:Fur family ferric uptake transcriptional regulator